MQSAPSEALPNATSVDRTQETPSPSQHGFPHIERQASDGALSRSNLRESTQSTEGSLDNVSVSSGGTRRGRSTNAGRLSRQHSSSQESSPGSRISDYERAFTNYRRPSDELIFQVFPKVGDKSLQVSIESFPNGKDIKSCLQSSLSLLTTGRGPYAYLVLFACGHSIFDELGIPPIP